MNAVCHVAYPFVNAILPVPITRPPDQMCVEAPGTVIAFGLFFAVCAQAVVLGVSAVVRALGAPDTPTRR